MAKKIKLSDIKVKSFENILNKEERMAAKGGYYNPRNIKYTKITTTVWTANTIVDIRDPFTPTTSNKKGKLSNLNSLNS